MTGSLLLMPNALDLGAGEVPLTDVLPAGVIARAAALTHWAAEDARSARAFLKRVGAIVPLAAPLQAIAIAELPRPRKGSREPVPASEWQALLQPARDGHDLGLISEAGLPAVADPGALLVAAAHEAGVPVVALPGPSSLLLALAASGLNGQSFAFVGYLPTDAVERAARVQALQQVSRRERQTQIAIETPYRNTALLRAMIEHLQPSTRLCVASGLTLSCATCRTRCVADWRANPVELADRVPAVFLFLAA